MMKQVGNQLQKHIESIFATFLSQGLNLARAEIKKDDVTVTFQYGRHAIGDIQTEIAFPREEGIQLIIMMFHVFSFSADYIFDRERRQSATIKYQLDSAATSFQYEGVPMCDGFVVFLAPTATGLPLLEQEVSKLEIANVEVIGQSTAAKLSLYAKTLDANSGATDKDREDTQGLMGEIQQLLRHMQARGHCTAAGSSRGSAEYGELFRLTDSEIQHIRR